MFRLFLAALMALLVSACGATNKPKQHTHNFKATLYHNPVVVHLVLYESRDILNQQYQILIDDMIEKGEADPGKRYAVNGFAIFNKEHNRCTIHVVQPDGEPQTIEEYGHEFMHCVFGSWHGSDPRSHSRH